MRKFTQAVSMECRKEQYEADLRDKMLGMGYIEHDLDPFGDSWDLLVNNVGGEIGEMSNLLTGSNGSHSRYFIDHYNPELFLAIAAMCDSEVPLIGMHWMCIEDVIMSYNGKTEYNQGRIYATHLTGCITNNSSDSCHEWDKECGLHKKFRPATLEELISHYTKQSFDPNNVVSEETQETGLPGKKSLQPNSSNMLTAEFKTMTVKEIELSRKDITIGVESGKITLYQKLDDPISFTPQELRQILSAHDKHFVTSEDPYNSEIAGKD